MKRITISIILLCALAVMTLFITTSCKGKILGGPDIPEEPGEYIKCGGDWILIQDSNVLTQGFYNYTIVYFERRSSLARGVPLDRFDSAAIYIQGDAVFSYCRKLGDGEQQSLGFVDVSRGIKICVTLICGDEGQDQVVTIPYINSECVSGVDKSNRGAGYVLFEIDQLPESRNGTYVMPLGENLLPDGSRIEKVICFRLD